MRFEPPSPWRKPGRHPDDWGPKQSYYRIEDHRHSHFDEDGEPTGAGYTELVLKEILVKRYTPKGVRLANDRVVLHNPDYVKRYACPTIEEALESYRKRKQKQASIYEARMLQARRCEQASDRFPKPGLWDDTKRWQKNGYGRERKITL